MFIVAAIAYAISIFIDVFVYHLKYQIDVSNDFRYNFSLINIFQYSARLFILIFSPILAYYAEKINDKNLVINTIILSHFFTMIVLFLLIDSRFSLKMASIILKLLSRLVNKKKIVNLNLVISNIKTDYFFKNKKHIIFVILVFISGFCFSFSVTFTYLFYFYYKNYILLIFSFSQIINMVGSLINILIVDPRLMMKIDNNNGDYYIKLLTKTRFFVHFIIFLFLLILKIF